MMRATTMMLPFPRLPCLPELRPCPALCADRSGNGRSRGAPDLQLPGMQPLITESADERPRGIISKSP